MHDKVNIFDLNDRPRKNRLSKSKRNHTIDKRAFSSQRRESMIGSGRDLGTKEINLKMYYSSSLDLVSLFSITPSFIIHYPF